MRNRQDNPISIVLLLRWPCRWSKHELVAAAERAWGAGQPFTEIIAEHAENKTVLISPPHIITLLSYDRPYLDGDPHIEAKAFHESSQQEAWARHSAWTALDYHGAAPTGEKAYGILAGLAAELLDANCTAAFLPGERRLISNDEALSANLRSLAANAR